MKSIKVRIYPNKSQIKQLDKEFGCSRYIYNKALSMKKQRYEQYGDNLHINEIAKMVTFWKKTEELKWLGEVSIQGLQQSLRHLDKAYSKFFKNKKGFPKFKKKSDKQSISSVKRVKVYENKIQFPKLGRLKTRGFKYKGIIKSATITKNKAGQYHMSFPINTLETPKVEIKSKIGLDLGIKDFCIDSEGNKYNSNLNRKYHELRIKHFQRKMNKSKKGSKNKDKWRLKYAKEYLKLNNKKNDFLHKLSTKLVKNQDLIVVEKLQIKNMIKNHKLAKSIQDANWSEFRIMLKYKCELYGKHFIEVDPKYTSQECSICRERNSNLTLKDRIWTCICGKIHDRDINAAINIRKKGETFVLKSSGDIINR